MRWLAVALMPALRPRCGAGASAQQVVVVVNGEPITALDIDQRSKLIQLSTHKTPTRQEVIEELIDEKLKIQLLKRYGIEGIDKDVDTAFANMARRMRVDAEQISPTVSPSRASTPKR